VEQVAKRLRRSGLSARTVTLKLRYGDFTTITRSRTLPQPTNVTEELWQAARGLIEAWALREFRPLRLLGATASGLQGRTGSQLSLFEYPGREKLQRLDETLDRIAERFGEDSVQRGRTSEKDGRRKGKTEP
jgi:DNA polymerase-4